MWAREPTSPDDAGPQPAADLAKSGTRGKGRLLLKRKAKKAATPLGALPETFAAPTDLPQAPLWKRLRGVLSSKPASNGPEDIRKADITVIDGRLLVHVSVRRGVVTQVTHTECESPQEAVTTVAKRGGDVVWASPGVRGFHVPVPDGSPRARRFLDASSAAKTFGAPARMVRQGQMLFGMSDEALAPLLRKCRVRFSACAVHERNGYWLRVGQSLTEMAMVQDGEIVQWSTRTDTAVDHVAEMISLGRPAVEALNEQTIELAKWVAHQRNQWLLRASSSGTVLLHGPGEGWTGVDTVLREVSSCRVVSARVIDVDPAAAGPQVGHVTAAVLGYLAPQAFSTRKTLLAEAMRARLKHLLPILATSAAVLVALILSWQQGTGVRERVSQAQQRLTAAAALDTPAKIQLQEDRQLAEQALSIRTLGEELVGAEKFTSITEYVTGQTDAFEGVEASDLFAWRSVLSHKLDAQIQDDPGRDIYAIEISRCEELNVEELAPMPGFAGIEQTQETMTAQAVSIFGPEATATNVSSSEAYAFDDEDRSAVRYTLRSSPEVCPDAQ